MHLINPNTTEYIELCGSPEAALRSSVAMVVELMTNVGMSEEEVDGILLAIKTLHFTLTNVTGMTKQ